MRLQPAIWQYIIRRAARRHGIIDPISLLARLRSFSQPSEVKEPMTLMRAGLMFHARGLVNARAIQFNLDWVWPYWAHRQFDPADPSFIPRGYAPTHVNLTQRNWTAVGVPGVAAYPLVDPRGLVTPFFDGWSLDFWLFSAGGRRLLPSKLAAADQTLLFDPHLAVQTNVQEGPLALETKVQVEMIESTPTLTIHVAGDCGPGGRLGVGVRPYNPEGIHFIETIEAAGHEPELRVDGGGRVRFDRLPSSVSLSNYADGDVLLAPENQRHWISCDIGMATGAAFFSSGKGGCVDLDLTVPLDTDPQTRAASDSRARRQSWPEALEKSADLRIPDKRISYLFEAAKRALILLSAAEIYPGPFTYRRFWFRDAVLMGNAMLVLNMERRLGRHLKTFPDRQKRDGFFESQEGEWDANGQVLWLMDRWQRCSRMPLDSDLVASVRRGADWIIGKRIRDRSDPLRYGLLPAGFSAEHLGPNDFYYWDDFWGVAGLQAAAGIFRRSGDNGRAEHYAWEADDFEEAVFRSIRTIPEHRSTGGIPASPYRRMDAGAVGSMVADYPLQITPPGNARILHTLEFLLENSFFRGGFFQNMVHSGINVYLTLDLAQTLLRVADPRYRDLLEAAADLASPTGQWPEAVHPFSEGGCMGDGQHGWAAAEWVCLIRNLFIREEGDGLILGSGVLPQWFDGSTVSFGPTLTPHGKVSLTLYRENGALLARVDADWHETAPEMSLQVPGFKETRQIQTGKPVTMESAESSDPNP